jgi:hypothetical protein
MSTDHAKQCVPVPSEGSAVIADQIQLAEGVKAVTLEAAELIDPVGLAVQDVYAVQSQDGVGVGSMLLEEPDPLWSSRVPAEGARITGTVYWSVAFVLKREGAAPGTSEAVMIHYKTEDGELRRVQGNLRFELKDRCG